MNRRLVVSYVVLVAVAIAAFTVPVAFVLTGQLRDDVETSVHREASAAALLVAAPSRQALVQLVAAYQQESPGRLDVLLANGTAATPLPPRCRCPSHRTTPRSGPR